MCASFCQHLLVRPDYHGKGRPKIEFDSTFYAEHLALYLLSPDQLISETSRKDIRVTNTRIRSICKTNLSVLFMSPMQHGLWFNDAETLIKANHNQNIEQYRINGSLAVPLPQSTLLVAYKGKIARKIRTCSTSREYAKRKRYTKTPLRLGNKSSLPK